MKATSKRFDLNLIGLSFGFCLFWIAAGCGRAQPNDFSLSTPADHGIRTITVTAALQSVTPSPTFDSPTAFPASLTATPVPPGIFPLLFYQPLVMFYEVSEWEDSTPYNNPNAISNNSLQSKIKSTCRIGVQGPTNFNDPSQYKSEKAALGNIDFEVKIFSNNPDGTITAFYIDDHSVDGYDYENAFPVLVVQSKENEWEECRHLGETVLSTLNLP